MQEIKILFFILGSFFGVNESQIISEKTTVTIDPTEKTILIVQENLISITEKESDSITLTTELIKISRADAKWDSEFNGYPNKEKEFYLSEEKQTLNSKLKLTYSKIEDLEVFGVDVNNKGEFSITDFPKHHITTLDGTLNDRYWNFKADQPFSFTIEPLIDMPDHYKSLVKSLFPIWKAINEQ